MKENDFSVETEEKGQMVFSQRLKTLLIVGMIFTGIFVVMGIITPIMILMVGREGMSWMQIAGNLFFFFCMADCFFAMRKIYREKKPFSQTLTRCIYILGILFIAAAVVFPMLEGYRDSGVELLGMDGKWLTPGIVLLIFGGLVQEGFQMQKEIDEIL